jgi:hypothetical protein
MIERGWVFGSGDVPSVFFLVEVLDAKAVQVSGTVRPFVLLDSQTAGVDNTHDVSPFSDTPLRRFSVSETTFSTLSSEQPLPQGFGEGRPQAMAFGMRAVRGCAGRRLPQPFLIAVSSPIPLAKRTSLGILEDDPPSLRTQNGW